MWVGTGQIGQNQTVRLIMLRPLKESDYQRLTIAVILAVLALRLCALFLSPLGLHGDEAQYWAWSKELDWGYFTKPPMIAWVIAATTTMFGDAEWAARLSSAPLHALTSYMLFLTGRKLFDARTGFWATCIYWLMPAVWLSSMIISTDVALLLFFVTALNAWVHLRADGPHWGRALQLGLAIGLGVLAKYAMLFFLPALILCMIFDKPTRAALLSAAGIFVLALALFIIMPNILWNINNDFATLSHTADNANLGHSIPFHPLELFSFIVSQFGVFGPLSFSILLATIAFSITGTLGEKAKWVSLFCLSPLLIICVQALLSRANANWAVTAYIAGSLLTAHAALTLGERLKKLLAFGVVFQSFVAVVLIGAVLSPSLTNQLPLLPNVVKRLREWPATVRVLEDVISKGHDGHTYEFVATDKRIVFYNLNYYGLQDVLPLKMWMLHSAPTNHAELMAPLPRSSGPTLLIEYDHNHLKWMKEDFTRLEALPPLDIDLGGGKRRQLNLWAGYDYRPTKDR